MPRRCVYPTRVSPSALQTFIAAPSHISAFGLAQNNIFPWHAIYCAELPEQGLRNSAHQLGPMLQDNLRHTFAAIMARTRSWLHSHHMRAIYTPLAASVPREPIRQSES